MATVGHYSLLGALEEKDTILLGCARWLSEIFNAPDRVLLGFTLFYWVLPRFT